MDDPRRVGALDLVHEGRGSKGLTVSRNDLNGQAPDSAQRRAELPHGTHCDCRLLAQATQLDPRHLSRSYCVNVLQRRWKMTCRHGLVEEIEPHKPLLESWRGDAALTAVDAVLVGNA